MTPLIMVWTILGASGLNAPTDGYDTLVVCPPEFAPELRPWIAHRRSQGHRLTLQPSGTSAEIRAAIRQVAAAGSLQSVLLVGDAPGNPRLPQDQRLRTVPTHLAKAQVNLRWGSEPEIGTDNWYADLDDDQIPDVAIGRLPATNRVQLRNMLGKILAYETTADQGEWRRRINLVAGVGGFGSLIDAVLELTTQKFLTDGIPDSYATHMTYGSWQSPYCPNPMRFHEAVVQRFNEGCLFWIYVGHGQRTALDRVQVPGRSYHIFANRDVPKLAPTHAFPIALFLACYAAAFDGPQDCLGEVLVRSTTGPVAVLGGTRVTMPYGMAVFANGLMDQLFREQRATLGEVLLHAKRQLAAAPTKPDPADGVTSRQLLDALGGAFANSPQALAAERLEHLHLINLLGDPLLRIRQPQLIQVEAPASAVAGQTVLIRIDTPIPGSCSLELICRRGRLRNPHPARSKFDPAADALNRYDQTYDDSNRQTWSRRQLSTSAGSVALKLTIPTAARGACQVRVFVAGQKAHAQGSANLFVKRPTDASPNRSRSPSG